MSALRTLRQLTTASSRVLVARNLSTVSRRALPALAARTCVASSTSRAFSVSARVFGEGTNVALVQRLQEELNYEKETAAASTGAPDFLTAFNEQGVWEIQDKVGNDEIVLTRRFGNEDLRLIFSIADIQGGEEDFQQEESQSETETEQEGGEDRPFHTYPIRVALSVTKTTTPGCMNVDLVCQEGNFIVENVSYYEDAKLGLESSAEADWKRRGTYIGPQFETLDVAVQEEFEKFLQERGVNENLALFIPEYAEHKEQTEYVKWLNNVKGFVEK